MDISRISREKWFWDHASCQATLHYSETVHVHSVQVHSVQVQSESRLLFWSVKPQIVMLGI